MAHFATPNQSGSGLLNVISNFFASLWNASRQQAELDSRLRQMRKLEAMSDAELAKRGIARDRIAHHVFRDIYYV
ncbi:MAG: hypothetical protein HKN27_07390 [Silicimonas sp.]|nr:hypothetical protein [Silicimonas sp.]